MVPLLLAGLIVVTPKYRRLKKEMEAWEKRREIPKSAKKASEEEGFDPDLYFLDIKRIALDEAKGPSDRRRVESVKEADWITAKLEAQKLIDCKMQLQRHTIGRSPLIPTLEDLERMEGFVHPTEMLVREYEYGIDDVFDTLSIEGRVFRPRHAQDLIAFGQFIRQKLDEGSYDGWRLDTAQANGQGYVSLYRDWFMMLGCDTLTAEELVWNGEKPWFDLNAQRAGLVG